jgi:hypothetical protein
MIGLIPFIEELLEAELDAALGDVPLDVEKREAGVAD